MQTSVKRFLIGRAFSDAYSECLGFARSNCSISGATKLWFDLLVPVRDQVEDRVLDRLSTEVTKYENRA
jgi:hypothetical protein